VRSWNPISSGGPGTDQGYIITDSAGNQYWTSDDGTLTYQRPAGGFWDRTPIANPASLTPGGNVSEAEFIAADAAQLAAQTGNNTAAIEQNLIYAGVDPITAATAANMAASGATTQQIADAISADVTAPAPVSPTAPSTQEPGGTGITADNLPAGEGYELVGPAPIPPGGDMGGGTGLLPPTYPNLPDMGGGQGLIVPGVTPEIITPPLTPEPPAITDSQIGAIVAAPTIPNPLEPPPTPGRPDMGSFTPAPPDASWSTPLQYPGVNPGLVGGAVRPAYQTTSPVQSQYYWGRQPYFAYTEDLANYNQVAMPSQPWGQQQGYFEQPLALPQIPVYGENMFVQPRAFAQPQVQDYFAPSLNMPQYMLPPQIPQMVPNSPNYIYDIRPTAGQYSVPGSSPV
jgi:hypothetical protein